MRNAPALRHSLAETCGDADRPQFENVNRCINEVICCLNVWLQTPSNVASLAAMVVLECWQFVHKTNTMVTAASQLHTLCSVCYAAAVLQVQSKEFRSQSYSLYTSLMFLAPVLCSMDCSCFCFVGERYCSSQGSSFSGGPKSCLYHLKILERVTVSESRCSVTSPASAHDCHTSYT